MMECSSTRTGIALERCWRPRCRAPGFSTDSRRATIWTALSCFPVWLRCWAHRGRAITRRPTRSWMLWRTTGAAAGPALAERLREQGIGMISPEDGIAALERIVLEEPAQVGVLSMDWQR